jgi:hypothetical protein
METNYGRRIISLMVLKCQVGRILEEKQYTDMDTDRLDSESFRELSDEQQIRKFQSFRNMSKMIWNFKRCLMYLK